MHALRLTAVAGLVSLLAAAPHVTLAQSVTKPAADAKALAPTGVKSFEAGAKAFEAGKLEPAVQALTSALALGGLSSQQMAKALYYRGAAYRKQGKPAQAISDLTSSVWLKAGLSDADRAAAMDQRTAAYKEAGLGAPAALDQAPAAAVASLPVVAPQPAPGAPAVSQAAPAGGGTTSSWTAVTSATAALEASTPASVAPVAAAAPIGLAPSASPDAPTLSALPPESGQAAPPVASPLDGAGSAIGNAGSAIGNFFGSMFQGSSATQATTGASSNVATASTGAPASVPAGTGDWSAQTEVSGAPSNRSSPVTVSTGGAFKLQVAAVRSREEAAKLAQDLQQKHGAKIGGTTPVVDEAVLGNMGTFYRVRLGPYSNATDPGKVCGTLKPHGYDCMVVSN
jgi:tetratricopeptide (TPR) repeat protein